MSPQPGHPPSPCRRRSGLSSAICPWQICVYHSRCTFLSFACLETVSSGYPRWPFRWLRRVWLVHSSPDPPRLSQRWTFFLLLQTFPSTTVFHEWHTWTLRSHEPAFPAWILSNTMGFNVSTSSTLPLTYCSLVALSFPRRLGGARAWVKTLSVKTETKKALSTLAFPVPAVTRLFPP